MSIGLISPSITVSKPFPHLSFSTNLSVPTVYFKPSKATPIRASSATSAVYIKSNTSFYDVLGISESATISEIKQAYKQLAKKCHPDVSPRDRIKEYTQRFIQVHEAYETLSDPQTRAIYDRNLAAGLHLAFDARKPTCYGEEFDRKNAWKNLWESQLLELSGRNVHRDTWGARMRRQKSEVLL